MTTIDRIAISHHRVQLTPPFRAAWDGRARHHFDATIVRVFDTDGRMGIGSGDLMLGFEVHESLFEGRDPLDLTRHNKVLTNIDFHYGRCWPLDIALWDLAGQINQEPIWRLLGGSDPQVPVYASSGALHGPEELADLAQAFLDQGFPAMKIRFRSRASGGWREDMKGLEAVRARVGDKLTLMVDCNQGWQMPWDTEPSWTFEEALPVARELERLDVFWMEEPLHRADLDGHRRLRDMTSVKIAGGEMTRELSSLLDMVDGGAFDIVQPDAALVGGITGLAKFGRKLRGTNTIFTPHTWTNGLGMMANFHLMAGIGGAPFVEFPYDPPTWGPDRRDYMLSHLITQKDGVVTLSDEAGLGISLDEERLAATRLD
ncbi:mandelate racemase/muconate lactonizing enzyme family protein [Parvibaculaceae bacterium PLY_AMNH_Bact1]|nr:mandelate racemase/muconate lactonizing enzyme family protein [Parvibaculaceae bacterium PLY_AMNH_Bact1]